MTQKAIFPMPDGRTYFAEQEAKQKRFARYKRYFRTVCKIGFALTLAALFVLAVLS